MNTTLPLTRELVLIGGGHTHALVLKRWGMKPLAGARLTVVNPGPTAPYTGMLPGYVAGHYGRDELELDLVRLARFAGARLILGAVDAIDRAARRIHIAGRGEIAYDIASIDIGITTDMPQLEGFADHGIGAKPLGAFASRWAAHLKAEETGDIAVIGGGVGGIELAMAMAHARAAGGRPAKVTVIDRSAVLEGVGARARPRLLREAASLSVSWIENASVARLTGAGAELADGRTVKAGLVVGVAGARPYDWLAGTGLKLKDGYIVVDEMLRSSDPAIYAAGDCAHLAHAPRPKAGVYAVRAAPALERNLRADLSGNARRPFRPQKDYLKLISLGRKAALGEKYGLPYQGDWVWRWKDRLD
ncbi:MAG: FAD-dependent oxidoreductase, partial [Rhodobacteraceae bacterium]|nr:FAD-dependent oxidoreductase [Paracoccaceae bacterium]